jgi:hypothetical protein
VSKTEDIRAKVKKVRTLIDSDIGLKVHPGMKNALLALTEITELVADELEARKTA